MATMQTEYARVEVDGPRMELDRQQSVTERRMEKWAHWPVRWSAVWVGTLAAFAAVLLFGLIGIAIGAHILGPEHRVVDLKKLSIGAMIFSVCGTFFSFVIGGWVAGKIAGIFHSEPAMLHGAIVWLVAVPMLLVTGALGAASLFGGWYASFAATPSSASTPFVRPDPLLANATADEIAAYKTQLAEYNRNLQQWKEETPKATRNSALGAVTALLLGLMGSVVGGWMAAGEPMNFSHHRTRKPMYYST